MRIRLIARAFGLVLTGLMLTLCTALTAAAAPPVRLVSDVWAPFTDVQGKPREALDLVESALLRGGVKAEFSIMTWQAAASLLEQGKMDGSAAVWKDPAREKYLIFSRPYLENRLVLVTRKGEDVSATSMGQLAGKRLALTKGYAYGDAVTKAANVQLVYRDNDEGCLRAVLGKQADYLLLDELMVRHLFQFYASKAKALIVAGNAPLVVHPLHFALNHDYPRAREIIADFNRSIERMMADGTYNRLLHVPWVQTDVDGDGRPEYVASAQSALKSEGDPKAERAGYALFRPAPQAPEMTRAPAYLIDGKSYDTWGDAASSLPAGAAPRDGAYKYSTGFVLGEF